MKTDQEKLWDAVGMLDGETVQTAMTRAAHMQAAHTTRRATLRRRAVILTAACLLLLIAGAFVAIPFMTADEPSPLDTADHAPVDSVSQNADDTTAGMTDEYVGEVNDKPINWNLQTDAYAITESDGFLYLNFTEEYRATQEQINNCQLGEVKFASLEDMRQSFLHNQFESNEYVIMQASFPKTDGGIRLCHMNALWDAQRPASVQITAVALSGEYYDHHVKEEGMFSFGWVRYVSEQQRDSLKGRDYIQYNQSYRTVTRKEAATFDGVACEIVESNSQYEYYRDIYIDIEEEGKTVSIVLRYLIDYTKDDGRLIPSETAPARVLMFGEQNGAPFVVSLYEFTQTPTYEWLSSFGLTPYVPSADSDLPTE
jgi:hypothetical protein